MDSIKNQVKKTVEKNKALFVSQYFLEQIMMQSCYSLKRISQETQIPYSTLYRLYRGITREPRPLIFQKILGLYCYYCQ